MNKRLIVLTSENGSREDGNVFYARYYLLESPTLTFQEMPFQDELGDVSHTEIIELFTSLGYTVTELDATIMLEDMK